MNQNINLIEGIQKIETLVQDLKAKNLEKIKEIQDKINDIKNDLNASAKLSGFENKIKELNSNYFKNGKLDLDEIIKDTNNNTLLLNDYLWEYSMDIELSEINELLIKSVNGYINHNTSLKTIEVFLLQGADVNVKDGSFDLLTLMYHSEHSRYRTDSQYNQVGGELIDLGNLLFENGFKINLESFKFSEFYIKKCDLDEFDVNYISYLVKNIHPSDIREIFIGLSESNEFTKEFKALFLKKLLKFHGNTFIDLIRQ